MYFFIHGGRGAFQKNYSDEGGGGMRKKSEIGGEVIQLSNYNPPNPTSPPYPIKNERPLFTRQCKPFKPEIPQCNNNNNNNNMIVIIITNKCKTFKDKEQATKT